MLFNSDKHSGVVLCKYDIGVERVLDANLQKCRHCMSDEGTERVTNIVNNSNHGWK